MVTWREGGRAILAHARRAAKEVEASGGTETARVRLARDLLRGRVGDDQFGRLALALAALTVAFVRRYAGRVGAVHVKDIRQSVAESVKRDGGDYRDAGARHIWTEPGRGDLDLIGAIKALGDFDDWFVVEVDIADQPTVEQSAKVAAEWLRPRLAARIPRSGI